MLIHLNYCYQCGSLRWYSCLRWYFFLRWYSVLGWYWHIRKQVGLRQYDLFTGPVFFNDHYMQLIS